MVVENKYLIISDIHGNLSAYNAVISDCSCETFKGIIILGDLIDYGMRSNEIIERISSAEKKEWNGKILANIWGNHERLIIHKDLDRLSSDRGRDIARYTARQLSGVSVDYVSNSMENAGKKVFDIDGCRCLAVHGSLYDHYWKSVFPGESGEEYAGFDFVFSGHSHYSHCFTSFYDVDNPDMRNKKAVVFINPGSVGQPRNHNPYAQYAVLSLPSKRVELRAVEYDIGYEQSLYNNKDVDTFYCDRLKNGV